MPLAKTSSFETLRKSLRGGFMTKHNGQAASCAPEAGFATSALAVSFPKLALSAAVALTLGMGLGVTDASAQQYFDGTDIAPDGGVDGGTGPWDAGTANWTNAAGDTNSAYAPNTAMIFSTTGGTVTVASGQAAGDFDFQVTGYTITGDNLELTSVRTINVVAGTATIDSNLVLSGGIDKTGTGTLVLGGSNSFPGGVSITAGTVSVTGGSAIENTGGAVDVGASGTFNVAASELIDALTGSGSTTIDAAQTLTIGINGGASNFSGVISGDGNLVTNGAVTLSGVNTYAGTTDVNNNILARLN